MKIQLEGDERKVLKRVARENGVMPNDLLTMYVATMVCNLPQDLHDISKELLEGLKNE